MRAALPDHQPTPGPMAASQSPARASLTRRLGAGGLLGSTAIVFAGTALARLLGFFFYVVSARLLLPADYGLLAYALALVMVASILVTTAGNGLARFVARSEGNRLLVDAYVTNWSAVLALALVASLVVLLPLGPALGLNGWLLVGAALNVANLAVFDAYLQAQRGLSRFRAMACYYVLANLLQLLAVIVLAAMGWRSPALFLIVYGLSAIVGLALQQLIWPIPVSLRLVTISRQRVISIARYIRPFLLHGVFYGAWWGADLILVQHLLNDTATGNYAAAKTLAQALIMAPTAIAVAAGPRLSRLPDSAVPRYLVRMMALCIGVVLPLAAVMILFRHELTFAFFGAKYPGAALALTPLVAGTALHGLYLVLSSAWFGLGRPAIGPVATGVGTVVTVLTALALIPLLGIAGAGLGFAAGAMTQVAIVGAYTVWGLWLGPVVRLGQLPDEAVAGFAEVRG